MDIKFAEFILSAPDVGSCPKEQVPEYAFVGRSNVGKSSLINMLVRRRKMAKTAAMPGKTQLINYFKINNKWFMVDLPGYGYAKAPKDLRETLEKRVRNYLEKRKQLTAIFLLIDVRHKPLVVDIEFMKWLGGKGLPFSIVFTKADKLEPYLLRHHIKDYLHSLEETWEELPPYFITSSFSELGRDAILDYIHGTNEDMMKNMMDRKKKKGEVSSFSSE
jgi:GTP-binding protein